MDRGLGSIVLQGGGPFEANDDLDRRVVTAAGIDRVVMLPTADAYERPSEMVASAQAWATRLGSMTVEPLMVLTRGDVDQAAVDAVAGATVVFLAGDSGNHLRSVLKDTPLWDALVGVFRSGGTVIAAGNSAAALCDPMTDRRGGGFAFGLGLVPGLALVPEAETWPAEQLERARQLATSPLVELPTGSALVWAGGAWERVGEVTVHGELPVLVQ